ncbi:MAG: ABC transporter permease subunit [Anaerolineae bacterium]|jgi:multiple sugar transport system permease protein|nr:ABC transporter permease subunit [Anaerolineae bacterium]
MANMSDKKREETITAYAFMAPALFVFLFFLIIPIGFAVYISFTNWNGITPLAQQSAVASGTVTFTNLTADTITIPAGTQISNGNPESLRVYQTDLPLTLTANGTGEVSVIALEPGRDSNVRRRQLDTIEDPNLAALVSVENNENIENGLDQAFEFVGMENYSRLLFEPGIRQSDFFLSLKNTVYFVLGVVPAQTLLSLLLATVVNQRWLRGKGLFRTAFYFPSITSSVVISIIFMWMFTQSGLVNTIIQAIFPNYQAVNWLEDPNGVIHNILGLFGVNRSTVGDWAQNELAGLTLWEWISGPSVTMLTIMILNTWTTIGTMMVIYLAALQNIPGSVYEAASIDGATGWQQFRRITVPLLTPTTFFVVTLGLIGTFQVFDQIFVISSGGPAKTTLTIAYIVYSNGFQNSQMGLAAATALLLFAIIFAFTMLQRRITRETLDA